MSDFDPNDPDKRISDGREHLGEEFARTGDERQVGRAFEDVNSYDDRKLGGAYDETTSSAKPHHKPLSERIPKPANRRFLFWFIAIVLLILVLALLFGWLTRRENGKRRDERADQMRTAEPVIETIKVARANNSTGITIPGTTTALEEAYVYGRANGYLSRRLVDIGDHVHTGQLLAIIDSPDLDQQVIQAREQVRQAEAQLDQQKAQLALADVTVKRYRALVLKGVFSRQDGDQAETNYGTALANVAAADRNVEAYKANLGHAIALQSFERVTSPFDGVITQRNVDVGALISASGSASAAAPPPPTQTGTGTQAGASNSSGSSGTSATLASPSTGGNQGGPLFAVAKVDRLRILASVPEGYASMISVGQPSTVYFQELPHQVFRGNVTRTAQSIDQNSRTMLTEVQLDNHAGLLKAGMYAVVTFAPGGTPDQTNVSGPLLISGDAIAIRNDRPTVAVVNPDGTIHLTPVELGRDYGSETEIVGGLQEGEVIAASFTDDILEGAHVKSQPDKNAQQQVAPKPASQPTPPGGSTQYSDPGITDQDMQGQNAKPQQKGQGAKQPSGPQKKGSGDAGSKP